MNSSTDKPRWSMGRCLGLMIGLIVLSASANTYASQRHALVIGNSDYNEGRLLNPRNDAVDMAAQLNSMGYEIFGGGAFFDLDRIAIERTVRSFARSLPGNANALFYFAGHGMSTSQDNYLVPIRHNLEYTEQLPDRAVGLKSVVDLLKNSNPEGINVVLLDACRDSPLQRSYRGIGQGLQKLDDIPRGVFIGYAADSGQIAEDGDGRNGTYTAELLKIMQEQPNVIIEVAHKEVAQRVFDRTRGKQFPVSENKVYGDWCFGTCNTDTLTVISSPVETPISPVDPLVSKSSESPNWKLIGGIVLGVIAVGLALQDGDDPPPPGDFTLILTPP